MKLVFVHDHIFYSDSKGDYFSVGGFPHYQWNKYLDHFSTVSVIARYGGIIKNDKIVKSSTRGVHFKFVESISNLKGLFNRKKFKQTLFDEISTANAVVIRLPSENGLGACRIVEKLHKPYAIEVVGCAWDALWNYGNIKAKIYAPILFLRNRIAISKANRVLYVSTYFLQKRYPAKDNAVLVEASNVDIAPFDNSVYFRKKTKLSENLNFDKKLIFGIIGNFKSMYKGIHIAIKALGLLYKNGVISNFELRILGKGDKQFYIDLASKLNIKSHLVFCGTLPNGDPVLNWLDDIDIYLQPSFTEGKPRTLIEAMSRACICLGADVGGIPELLSKKHIHKAGDYSQLAYQIEKLIELPIIEKEQISLINFKEAKHYTSDKINKRRSEFYSLLATEAQAQL